MRIRDARTDEREALEALQWDASLVWEEHRSDLLAHPDAIEVPAAAIAERRLRVAVDEDDGLLGFSLVLAPVGGVVELDGLFVLAAHQHAGIGRFLVADLVDTARGAGATAVEVTAGPAVAFYEKQGFARIGTVQTQFAPAIRLRLDLRAPEAVHGRPMH